MSTTSTDPPSAANLTATARPMPEPAPVTTQALLSSRMRVHPANDECQVRSARRRKRARLAGLQAPLVHEPVSRPGSAGAGRLVGVGRLVGLGAPRHFVV